MQSSGTDHALYRLGDELVVRLPRIGWPDEGYPWPWAVYRWLRGRDATVERVDTSVRAARDLARFLLALQAIEPEEGFPTGGNSRAQPLASRDGATRQAIAALGADLDAAAATQAWEAALGAPVWDQPGVPVHGDLLPGNLLVQDGRLSAVIDFSGLNRGDPACDLMMAWAGVTPSPRR